MIISNLITIIILIIYIGILYITLNNKNQLGMLFSTIATYLLISYKKKIFEGFTIGGQNYIQKFTIGGQETSAPEHTIKITLNETEDAITKFGDISEKVNINDTIIWQIDGQEVEILEGTEIIWVEYPDNFTPNEGTEEIPLTRDESTTTQIGPVTLDKAGIYKYQLKDRDSIVGTIKVIATNQSECVDGLNSEAPINDEKCPEDCTYQPESAATDETCTATATVTDTTCSTGYVKGSVGNPSDTCNTTAGCILTQATATAEETCAPADCTNGYTRGTVGAPSTTCPTGCTLTAATDAVTETCKFKSDESSGTSGSNSSSQQTCANFDCRTHANDLASSPGNIVCAAASCTPDECCKTERKVTCKTFDCSPFEANTLSINVPCINDTCSPAQCCKITSSDNNSNNVDDTVKACSTFKTSEKCELNRCSWNSETEKCNEPSSSPPEQRIKDVDPIPIIRGNQFLVNNNISSYDGLCINTGNEDYWKKSPDDLPLIDDKNLYTLQGHNSPLKPVIADYSSLYGPSIDGEDDSPNKLFIFSNNLSSPACCPSTFTTSTGCICTSKKQRDFITSRGKNVPRNYNDDIN